MRGGVLECNQGWGPAAHCSKANKETRLVERKVCFILDAGNEGAGRMDSRPKANSLSGPCM